MTRLEDLPPRLRRAAVAAIARDQLAVLERKAAPAAPYDSRDSRGAEAAGASSSSAWRCHACGERFAAWSRALAHVDAGDCHGAARLEWVMP
jgi:hypothetical protein